MGDHVFISHSTQDDAIVAAIRAAVEDFGVHAFTDSRELTGGDALHASIEKAIEAARHMVVVVSSEALASAWVKKEIEHGRSVQRRREDFKIIPLLVGLKPGVLEWLFEDVPLGVTYTAGVGAVGEVLPDLMASLGLVAASDPEHEVEVVERPIADLVLKLEDPVLETGDGRHRATATARFVYRPPVGSGERPVDGQRFRFTAPLGPIESGDLRWYLESYFRWPSGVFRQRARAIEAKLVEWGQALAEPLRRDEARDAHGAWSRCSKDVERRFSILVDGQPISDSSRATDNENEDKQKEGHVQEGHGQAARTAEAATLLLGLPWELCHDGESHLFEGARGVRVRRRLPNRRPMEPLIHAAPIRILLISPRPDDPPELYLDHRVSARPLVEALGSLGELAELKLVTPPTLKALDEALRTASEANRPFHVVHFDGHGVYDRRSGLGGLCFEKPEDVGKLEKRRSVTVKSDEIAAVMKDHRVPLVFLEACQTATAEEDPMASVAGRLLQGGVASVVAMSHSVLVETARRFVAAFYGALVEGRRVGDAMLAGQRELAADTYRGRVFKGELHLQDWFVPVLFQEENDPRLIARLPKIKVKALTAKRRELLLGDLPKPPEHDFVGRGRELLRAERLLERERFVVLLGEGGEGKTTLAAELARWLVETRRFRRAAFVSVEHQADVRAVLFALGAQLVPSFTSRAAAGGDDEKAWRLIERALAEQATIVVIDNLESVLEPPPGSPGAAAFEPEVLAALLVSAERLIRAGATLIIFTSRERLPAPFASNHLAISRLARAEAIELVGQVLRRLGLEPQGADEGQDEVEIERLVEAVNGHARSLVLLAPEVARIGVRHATERLQEIMASLAAEHPDDRERSLFASVELSLERLPEEIRRILPRLAVFRGGGHLANIAVVLELGSSPRAAMPLAEQLIGVGLAEMMPYDYLRLHPALGPALDRGLNAADREEARRVWVDAMAQLTRFLGQQRSKDAQVSATLTLLELPNLLFALGSLHAAAEPESIVNFATRLESLLQNLGRPRALARVVEIREKASSQLSEWSHARYLAESAAVDRLLDTSRFAEATEAAAKIVEQCLRAGESAFPEAAYDVAVAFLTLGRCLLWGGAAQASLEPIDEARRRFKGLSDAGHTAAAGMVMKSLVERGDGLTDLGRLEEAGKAYEKAIELAEAHGDRHGVAVAKGQLGTVQLHERKFEQALESHNQARETFEELRESRQVATSWHMVGMVHDEAGQFEAAERAYKESLKIKVQLEDRAGEASSLDQLGVLYGGRMGRLEDSVRFHRQAAAIRTEIEDLAAEGRSRNNLAVSLVALRRYDEARQELNRAIECKEPYGHALEPWTTFDILHDLERAVGDESAALAARERAVAAFLAYRRAGGENHFVGGRLALAVGQAMATGHVDQVLAQLGELRALPDLPASLQALAPALSAILARSRDPALAEDPALDYRNAVEIMLLLESLDDG